MGSRNSEAVRSLQLEGNPTPLVASFVWTYIHKVNQRHRRMIPERLWVSFRGLRGDKVRLIPPLRIQLTRHQTDIKQKGKTEQNASKNFPFARASVINKVKFDVPNGTWRSFPTLASRLS